MIEQLLKYQAKVYNINVKNGFWEGLQNRGERVMLIVSELGETVEAHRNERASDTIAFTKYTINNADRDELWLKAFKTTVKDTIEDELADVTIRILDYCKGFDVPIIEREYRKQSTGNFGHDILRIINYCIKAFHLDQTSEGVTIDYTDPGKDWGYVLESIIKLCEWNGIDLLKHIEWKLRYNSSRPYKHGKKY